MIDESVNIFETTFGLTAWALGLGTTSISGILSTALVQGGEPDAAVSLGLGLASTVTEGISTPVYYVFVVEDGSLNAVAYDKVEANAKKIYDKYESDHDETKIDNAAIVSNDVETTKELQKLLNKQEKNQLLNELEALKEYKDNNKKLILK